MAAAIRNDRDQGPHMPVSHAQPQRSQAPCVGLFCFAYESAGASQLPANDQDWMRMFEVRR